MLVPHCHLPSSVLAQATLPKYILPNPPSYARSFEGNSLIALSSTQKMSFKVVLHCQVTFPKARLHPRHKAPHCHHGHSSIALLSEDQITAFTSGADEGFSTVSSTKTCIYWIAPLFWFFTVTWIWAVRVISPQHPWLPLSASACTVHFPK